MEYNEDYILRLNLTSFIGSRIVEVEDEDEHLERGVFIPIERNVLYEDEKSHNIMCEAFVNKLYHKSQDNRTHSVKQKAPMAHVERLKNLGFDTPKLGGMWLNERYRRKGNTARKYFGAKKTNSGE